MSSGLKKFMHKVGDKLDISKGHHNDNNGGATKVRATQKHLILW